MKVKFELSEDDRLKAYYVLQLSKKLNPSCFTSDSSFYQYLSDFALAQFRIGLDADIASLEERIFEVNA